MIEESYFFGKVLESKEQKAMDYVSKTVKERMERKHDGMFRPLAFLVKQPDSKRTKRI